jgi:hypothetical protein
MKIVSKSREQARRVHNGTVFEIKKEISIEHILSFLARRIVNNAG